MCSGGISVGGSLLDDDEFVYDERDTLVVRKIKIVIYFSLSN